MKMKSRKGLSILLALMLVFAMSATPAFAAWPSFQNTNTNNGVTDVLVTTPVTTYDDLVNNWAGGINAPSVIDNGVSYTLYNGGYVNGTNGGARMQATTLSTASPVWNVQIDNTADNISQLSTPVLVGSDLYALTTGSTTLYSSSVFNSTNWTGTASISNVNNDATFAAGSSDYIYSNTAEVSFIAASTNITTEFALTPAVNDDAKYTLELYDGSNNLVATLVNNATLYGGYSTALNYYSGTAIPAGNYKIKLTITTDATNPITVTSISLSGNGWKLYKVATATGAATLLESGVGAGNTPITHSGDYLYFGIYGGDRSYYQYKLSTPTALKKFEANDDFYWAGATTATVSGTNYAVFGSDSGTVYWREVGSFDTAGHTVDLTLTQADAGHIRSSIVAPGDGYLYFTSQGNISSTGNSGYLWKFGENGTYVDHVGLPKNSTSTPVISGKNYVYVGYYDHGNFTAPEGGVAGVPKNNLITSALFDVYGNGVSSPAGTPGDPVQASPVVYADVDDDCDYIYFTTNASAGIGHCYSYDGSTAVSVWTAGGTSSNRYALQGFAADGDYLVYGDDGIRLYIIKE